MEQRLDQFVTKIIEHVQGFWQRNRLVLQTWLVFALIIGLFTMSLVFLINVGFDKLASAFTARMLASVLWLLGTGGHAEDAFVSSKIFSIEIIFECTAIFPIMIFLAAVVAYPCTWKKKLWGIALGVPAILFVNLIRLVSLVYIGHWFPSWFETAHLLVWQPLIIFFAVLFWLVWVEVFVHRHEAQGA